MHLTTVAIPVFRRRIAPVFDCCLRVLVIHIEHDHCIQRRQRHVDGLSLSERVDVLQRAGATTLICAGISDVLDNMLENAGIRVIEGIAGKIDDVLRGFISNRLHEPQFYMPGRLQVAKIAEGPQTTTSVATSVPRETGNKKAATVMKFAIPIDGGCLAAHFGHAPEFAIIQAEGREIITNKVFTPPAHEPGMLPLWLHQLGVEVVIAGRMGHRALSLFGQNGIEVVTGAPRLFPDELVHQYLGNTRNRGQGRP